MPRRSCSGPGTSSTSRPPSASRASTRRTRASPSSPTSRSPPARMQPSTRFRTDAFPRARPAPGTDDSGDRSVWADHPGLIVPGLIVPGLIVPGLIVPGLIVPGLIVPGLIVPGLIVSGWSERALLRIDRLAAGELLDVLRDALRPGFRPLRRGDPVHDREPVGAGHDLEHRLRLRFSGQRRRQIRRDLL